MSGKIKALAIITNHFKEQNVRPKIVYANKHLLSALDLELEEILDQEPHHIFSNWNSDQFMQEIVSCVDQGISWMGDLELNKTKIKKNFIITPVYTINGEISYYSCASEIDDSSKSRKDKKMDCLDEFVSSLWQFQSHFKEVYELSPANLLRIDRHGKINYVNKHAQELFGLKNNDNLFDLIVDNKEEIEDLFKSKKILGKISSTEFEIMIKNKIHSLKCRFWPLLNEKNKITGYSISLTDLTKKKDLANQLLALKGL